MPPKAKKKRASLKLDEKGQIQNVAPIEHDLIQDEEPSVRQVVEVVEEEGNVPEAIETIKKDAEEIAEAVSEIEEEVKESVEKEGVVEKKETSELPKSDIVSTLATDDVQTEAPRSSVESLFVKSEPGINPEITVVGKKGMPLGVWVGAMLGVALAIGVSLILLVRGPSTLSFISPVKPTPTPMPTVAPAPSAAAVNKNDINVRVVNGGGIPGAGSKMKTLLEEKGYTVVSVGNAEEYTFTQTEISAKADKTAYIALLTDDLKADYSLGTSSSSAIEASAAYDVLVTVGKE